MYLSKRFQTVYPEAISTLPFAKLWCALFFLMLISLGLDSAMGGLEAVIVGIMDEFQSWFKRKRINREIFTSIVIFLSFLISLINITQVSNGFVCVPAVLAQSRFH